MEVQEHKDTRMYKAIGLMSGTSLDGIDAALIETDGHTHIQFIGACELAYDSAFKADLFQLAREDIPLNDVLRLEDKLTRAHADTVNALLQQENLSAQEIDFIGFHGQTIRHLPKEGLTWQMGNAQLLSELTGVAVVSDFRKRDMAVSGEGAPFAPLFHQVLMHQQAAPWAILNIGGVGNITVCDEHGQIFASDTGPGNGLIDVLVQRQIGQACDESGALGLQGKIDETWVQEALNTTPFWQRKLPRSADRYDFDSLTLTDVFVQDGAATLAALTADAVAQTVQELPVSSQNLDVYVTGGGAYNQAIMQRLATHFNSVQTVNDLGFRLGSMEAELFAWLAVRHKQGLPMTLPTTTGCTKSTVGGMLTPVCEE